MSISLLSVFVPLAREPNKITFSTECFFANVEMSLIMFVISQNVHDMIILASKL